MPSLVDTLPPKQMVFSFAEDVEGPVKAYRNGEVNKLFDEDRPFHQWYRFVLSFPPHLVREYVERFRLKKGATIFDPFCGTGTTVVEAKLLGLRGIGVEANRMAYFASTTKTDWDVNPRQLRKDSCRIAEIAERKIKSSRKLRTLPDEQMELLLTDSISPTPLHKTLLLLEAIDESPTRLTEHQRLAFATSTVRFASNLHFGPEVGVSRKKRQDADVVADWLNVIETFCYDLERSAKESFLPSTVIGGDARNLSLHLEGERIDAVFTSPPYPNEKDYTRTTRLESVLLGFVTSKDELREMKQGLLRSNTRNIYKNDDDDRFIEHHEEVVNIAKEIEAKRLAMGKTSGFEKMYHRVVRQYFGGMAKHLESLKPFLKKGAMLGYVVGDQASFLRVHIPTGRILGDIAVHLGYELVSIDLFRTRFATATKMDMNEEVVVLRWKGGR